MDKALKELLIAYLEKSQVKFNAGKALLEGGFYEDAASRFYYAVYHAAQAILLTEGLKADTHQGLITLFSLRFIKPGKIEVQYGKMLSNLKDDREEGDYEVVSFVDKDTAQNACTEAQSFLKRIKDYLESYIR